MNGVVMITKNRNLCEIPLKRYSFYSFGLMAMASFLFLCYKYKQVEL